MAAARLPASCAPTPSLLGPQPLGLSASQPPASGPQPCLGPCQARLNRMTLLREPGASAPRACSLPAARGSGRNQPALTGRRPLPHGVSSGPPCSVGSPGAGTLQRPTAGPQRSPTNTALLAAQP